MLCKCVPKGIVNDVEKVRQMEVEKENALQGNWVERNSGKTTSIETGNANVESTKQRHRWNVFRSVGRIDDHHNLSKGMAGTRSGIEHR
jgi:hypothetical protein